VGQDHKVCKMEPRPERDHRGQPGYWGPKPPIQKATYRFVSDPGTRLAD
jgi:hypothetical protein